MTKQELAATIWRSANDMRSKIEASEYKDYILGFIFYRFLSEKEEEYVKKTGMTEEDMKECLVEADKETVSDVQKNIGYFISYQNLFSTWLKKGTDFSADDVTTALSAFNRLIDPDHKAVFNNIFHTLESGMDKLGESAGARTKMVQNLANLICEIPMNGKQGYDVLGFIYEYLISNFAANAGKKAGEFYTPHEVSVLMSEIVAFNLKGRENIQIYDPTSGSGSLLITIGKAVAKETGNADGIVYYAQELKEPTYNLTRMNLVMRGINPWNINVRNGDTLEDDWPWFDDADKEHTYNPLYVDAVVSNPPYSQKWDPDGKENDPRYKDFGLAPKSKADYAFFLHDLYHIKPDGVMTIVLPHGVLFRGGSEGDIRKALIERNNIDAIIGLPANIFFGTGIPTIIMVLKQKRPQTDVMIIDASKGFIKDGKNNRLRDSDIKRIVDTLKDRRDIDKFSRRVSKEEIRANDYNLNIPRYVDSSEPTESFDILSLMEGGIPNSELDALGSYWKAFPHLRGDLFETIRPGYCQVRKAESLVQDVKDSQDAKGFREAFASRFGDFGAFLRDKLIAEATSVDALRAEDEITSEIFRRADGLQLIDPYSAYQVVADRWANIENDLEILRADGINALREVDPNMVMKKTKNSGDKKVEVQDGWKGRVLSFDLVSSELLSDDKRKLDALNERLSEIGSEYSSILDSIDETDKDGVTKEDDPSAIDFKKVASAVKDLGKRKYDDPDSYEYKVIQLKKLNDEEKEVKKAVKELDGTLVKKTADTIRGLTDEEALRLLDIKWNRPIVDAINALPDAQIDEFIKKLQNLAKKYADTSETIETDIRKTSDELLKLTSEIQGSESDMKGLQDLVNLLKED